MTLVREAKSARGILVADFQTLASVASSVGPIRAQERCEIKLKFRGHISYEV